MPCSSFARLGLIVHKEVAKIRYDVELKSMDRSRHATDWGGYR